jgi:hypothetical protein
MLNINHLQFCSSTGIQEYGSTSTNAPALATFATNAPVLRLLPNQHITYLDIFFDQHARLKDAHLQLVTSAAWINHPLQIK